MTTSNGKHESGMKSEHGGGTVLCLFLLTVIEGGVWSQVLSLSSHPVHWYLF